MAKLDLMNNKEYIASSEKLAAERLQNYRSVEAVKADLEDINAYDNLDKVEEPKDVFTFDSDTVPEAEIERAKKTVLEGRLFCEHTAGGEATRLKLGPKYLINPAVDLTLRRIASRMAEETGREVGVGDVRELCGGNVPGGLLPISLGVRHMLQMVFGLRRLSEACGEDPDLVLKRQRMLIVINELLEEKVVQGFIDCGFYGFDPAHVYFMSQYSYPGIDIVDGVPRYREDSPRRLHNHGQLVMQETMEEEIFRVSPEGLRTRIKREEFGRLLTEMDDKISYNIEDLSYLAQAIDYESLALALKMGDQGYRMMMEIVANSEIKPQKGGLAAWDPVVNRNVMIESFQLKGLGNADIKFMNKNFNHYPHPYDSWQAVQENGLNMPVDVKGDYIYFQPVQGDINFLVKTQFIRRSRLKPIQAWKSAVTTPLAIKAMKKQDEQPGFRELCEKIPNLLP